MKNKTKKIIISLSAVLCALLISVLAVYFSGAWFKATRKAQGSIEFVEGIKFDYVGLYKEAETASNASLKLQTTDNQVLEIKNVTSNQVFNLKNPTITPKENTVAFYLRAKLEYKFYFKANESSAEKLLDDTTREEFLSTTTAYEKNGAPFVANNEYDLFENLPSFADSFVKIGDWFYLGTANSGAATLQDVNLTKNFYNNENTKSVPIFKQTNNEIKIAMDDSINYGEKMPFTKLEILLVVEAVEENALSTWNS